MTSAELELVRSPRHDPFGSVLGERTLRLIESRQRLSTPRRGWLVRRALLVADVVGLIFAFAFSRLAATATAGEIGLPTETLAFLLSIPAWIVVARIYGLYDRDEERFDHSTVDDLTGVFHLLTLGSWLLFLTTSVTALPEPSVPHLVTFWLAGVIAIFTSRSIARAFCRRQIAYLQNTIIVGAGEVGQQIARKLQNHPEYGINLVGFLDSHPKERHEALEHVSNLGCPSDLPDLIDLLDIERVIIAFSNDRGDESLALVRSIKDFDIQVDIVPRLFELVSPSVGVHTIEGIPLVGLAQPRLARSSKLLKRSMDIAGSLLGLIVLSPLLLAIAAAIKLDSKGPVLFTQERVGARNRTFRIYKFRTMVIDAEERKAEIAHLNMHATNGGDPRMFKVPDDPRITRVGKMLRRLSLDELPQLLNVLRSEMSLVGPRPLIAEEDRLVYDWARARLDIKPGVTGLWQVLGASDIPFEEMTKLDYLYVTNWSVWWDFKILCQTIPVVLGKRGAY
jgi:exopolysaccharide biosynthesis polyprenyl glycosylphosphotransferase